MSAFAVGDLTVSLEPRREDDALIVQLNHLRKAMLVVVDQADVVAKGNLDIEVLPRSNEDILGLSLQRMVLNLRENRDESDRLNWLKTSQNELAEVMRGDLGLINLWRSVLSYLEKQISIQVGSFYVLESNDEESYLAFMAGYALETGNTVKNRLALGERLVGQVALEQELKVLNGLPNEYLRVNSSLGSFSPLSVVLLPLVKNNKVAGVIELGSMKVIDNEEIELLRASAEFIAVTVETSLRNKLTKTLLNQTQKQSEEHLSTNENLETYTQQLRKSEEQLTQQSVALKVSNEEMELKAVELAQASSYKSAFLANMSHELRTPLNSLLILSKSLAENNTGNLTEMQQGDARIIYEGGSDLLELINDIMDLSKVEAGMLTLNLESVDLEYVADNIRLLFGAIAKEKRLSFGVNIDANLDTAIFSDGQKLQQIIKSFLSNAFKFTSQGEVVVRFHQIPVETKLYFSDFTRDQGVEVSVIDSGVGIPKDKQQAIFEAFQQKDGSTSRHYDGTGSGLTIFRELARLLKGEVHLSSRPGEGNVFTLYIPKVWTDGGERVKESSLSVVLQKNPDTLSIGNNSSSTVPYGNNDIAEKRSDTSKIVDSPVAIKPADASVEWIADDRNNISSTDNVILVIEDDSNVAKQLLRLGHDHQQKALLTDKGRVGVLLAIEYKPCGIFLKGVLPDIDGLQVLEMLKINWRTKDIAVHVLSEGNCKNASLEGGGLSYLEKPLSEPKLKATLRDISKTAQDAEYGNQ
ncbi:MAG: GAF domain-containing protein [Pseudomonadales bacterium]|nr:GAF domain-containing protein [Pseudomonadales bacterium]